MTEDPAIDCSETECPFNEAEDTLEAEVRVMAEDPSDAVRCVATIGTNARTVKLANVEAGTEIAD